MMWLWALVFRPFVIMALVLLILAPARWAVIRFCPEGFIKRLLLYEITKPERPSRPGTANGLPELRTPRK